MNIQYIRDTYHVPAKRGGFVRTNYSKSIVEGRITGTPRNHVRINIVTQRGEKLCLHPFEVDYYIDGEWISGKALQSKYDAAWDRFNAALNSVVKEPQP